MRITSLKPKITGSGIRTGSQITDEGKIAKVEIYAKPCSPFTFELTYKTFEGWLYIWRIRDNLPVSHDFDLENIMHVGALAHMIETQGQLLAKKINA